MWMMETLCLQKPILRKEDIVVRVGVGIARMDLRRNNL